MIQTIKKPRTPSGETHVSKLCFSENMSKVPNFYKLGLQ